MLNHHAVLTWPPVAVFTPYRVGKRGVRPQDRHINLCAAPSSPFVSLGRTIHAHAAPQHLRLLSDPACTQPSRHVRVAVKAKAAVKGCEVIAVRTGVIIEVSGCHASQHCDVRSRGIRAGRGARCSNFAHRCCNSWCRGAGHSFACFCSAVLAAQRAASTACSSPHPTPLLHMCRSRDRSAMMPCHRRGSQHHA